MKKTPTTPSTRPLKSRKRRPTIGFLTNPFVDTNCSDLWAGVMDAARERDVNLLCVVGDELRNPLGFRAQANVLYDLLNEDNVDGLILWGSPLSNFIGLEAFQAYCHHFSPIPVVVTALPVPGVPSILVDSYEGMRQAIQHLVRVHGYRRIGFIRGPEGNCEAENRYQAYRDVLRDHDIPVEPALVACAEYWFEPFGATAMSAMIDRCSGQLEAVAAANDRLALGVIETLRTHGFRVPQDIAVVGFDNLSLSWYATPPLTTVPLQNYEQGRRAVEMTLALLAGENVPEQVIIPGKLVVRQSCGCVPPEVTQAMIEPETPATPSAAAEPGALAHRDRLVAEIAQAVGIARDNGGRTEQFVDAFIAEMTGTSTGTFLSTLEEILYGVGRERGNLMAWQNALSVLRYAGHAFLPDERLRNCAERLYHAARVLIGMHTERIQAHQREQTDQQAACLREIGQRLITTFDMPKLLTILAEELPKLGIPECYLALYDDPHAPAKGARFVLAYTRQGRMNLESDGRLYSARQIAPEELCSHETPYNLLVEPLYFCEHQLGFVLFEPGLREGHVYDALRGEISSALQGALLVQRLQDRTQSLAAANQGLLAAKEEAEEARRAAEAANRSKSEFLARMSHEIRTPMNAIIGMTNLMLKTGLTATQKDYVGKTHEAGRHLLRIINDILDFSKIEAGKLELRTMEFLLHLVIEKTANMFRVKAAEKQIELFYVIGSDVPLALKGDPLRLGQVLINLISNAVKFTDRGEIIVRVELHDECGARASCPPGGGGQDVRAPQQVSLLFSVQDSGPGIPPDRLETLFQPFTQADDSMTRRHEGTGLGLAICQRLVAMMGGRIWGESQPGTGTTFSFTVTLERQAEEHLRTLHVPPDIRGMHALIVDDHETARQILEEMLRSFDLNVTTAASGSQALAELERAAQDNPYDLAILDWKMPEMDGFELAHRIHTHPVLGKETITPKMIMITMYGWEEFVRTQKRRTTEIDRYLLKPANSSELFNTIMEVFGKPDAMVPRLALEQESVDLAGLEGIRDARVLLVEDNEINQQVAEAILKAAGLLLDVASTGAKAVEMVTTSWNRFDAILMDIQMPIMDGYEATRRIRDLEAQQSTINNQQSTIPIIAMTAHAMRGDREKCLAAGMNDYVAKPIDERELYMALVKWIPPGKREIPEDALPCKEFVEESWQGMPDSIAGVDLQAGLDRLKGNTGLFKQLLRSFLFRFEHAADTISNKIEAGNFTEAQQGVHAIKGVSGNLGAYALFEASRELNDLLWETIRTANGSSVTEQPEGLQPALDTFIQTLEQVMAALNDLRLDDDATASVSQEPEAIDSEQAEQILRKMRGLLEKNSSRARHCLPELKTALPASQFREHLKRLDSAVYAVDFATAVSILEDIANTLNYSLKQEEP